jgi:hypothetical protein
MRKLILAVLLFLPLHAWADTCTKSATLTCTESLAAFADCTINGYYTQ